MENKIIVTHKHLQSVQYYYFRVNFGPFQLSVVFKAAEAVVKIGQSRKSNHRKQT